MSDRWSSRVRKATLKESISVPVQSQALSSNVSLPSSPAEAATGPDTRVETDQSWRDLPRVGPLGQDHQSGANNSEVLEAKRKI